MSMIDAIPLLAGAGADGYQISRSVRLRSSASAYLNRTTGTPTNANIWTWSAWVKRGTLGARNVLLCGGSTNVNYICFNDTGTTDYFGLTYSNTPSSLVNVMTTQVFRDPSSWYHLMVVYDSTSATSTITGTATDRVRLYVNGAQVTAFSATSGPSLNASVAINTASSVLNIGRRNIASPDSYLDGYLTEINFIDGQALTPSSFGETNSVTGVWQPKKYGGTYGTNGFYLNFSDNSGVTATTIGKDYSGNGNNWTPSAGISITAGVTYDSMLDVPTLWADGGNGRGNYPVWNPLTSGGLVTFTEANLKALSTSASVPYNIESTIKTATTGKWYAEVTMAVGASSPAVGIGNNPSASSSNTDQFTAYRVNGTYITSGMGASSTGTPATFTTNDVIGIAYDVGAGTLSFYKNGTLQTGGFTGITAGNYSFIVRKDSASGDGGYLNCGQRPFTYTPPTGFVALNTQNLPTPTISNGANYMAATTYAGSASTQVINSNMTALDFAWIKNRTTARSHALVDTVRGGSPMLTLYSDLTAAEDNTSANYNPTSISGSSITLGGAKLGINNSGENFVMWGWNAGGSTVTNTSGTISAQVRANPTAGFSVVTYTGNGVTAATVGHGLNAIPAMVIIKERGTAGTNWMVKHQSLASSNNLFLQGTNGTTNITTAVAGGGIANLSSSTTFNFLAGTSNTDNVNRNTGTFVAYCFAAVAGYSAFGSYTGNGVADGPFVYLGFRPRWVLIKSTTAARDWLLYDTARSTYNVLPEGPLQPNTAGTPYGAGYLGLDILSNGFKLRELTTNMNASGETHIFMAFAEVPFRYANAR